MTTTTNFQATFIIPDVQKSFEKLFAPELADVASAYKTKRASITFKSEAGKTLLIVDAQDAVALRAMTNGICKVLAIQEKMNTIK